MPDDDMAHFPVNYGENYLYILEVDPTHVHAFWEVTPETIPDQITKKSAGKHDLSLRFYNGSPDRSSEGNPVCLDLFVKGLTNDRFIELDDPPLRYYAELGYHDTDGAVFTPVCCSNPIETLLESGVKTNFVKLESFGRAVAKPAENPHEKNENFYAVKTKKQEWDEDTTNASNTLRPRDLPKPLTVDEDTTNAFNTAIHSQMKGSVEMGKPLEDRQGEERSYMLRSKNEKDIVEYYRTINDRMISEPEFSPWKSILESMSSEETKKTLWASDTVDVCEADPSGTEFHSSSLPPKSK